MLFLRMLVPSHCAVALLIHLSPLVELGCRLLPIWLLDFIKKRHSRPKTCTSRQRVTPYPFTYSMCSQWQGMELLIEDTYFDSQGSLFSHVYHKCGAKTRTLVIVSPRIAYFPQACSIIEQFFFPPAKTSWILSLHLKSCVLNLDLNNLWLTLIMLLDECAGELNARWKDKLHVSFDLLKDRYQKMFCLQPWIRKYRITNTKQFSGISKFFEWGIGIFNLCKGSIFGVSHWLATQF